MKKLLQILIAASLTLTGYAAGTGDGSSKANAIEFDWVNGNTQDANTALWYRVELDWLYEVDDPDIAHYLTNLSSSSAQVNISVVIADKEEAYSYTIAGNGSKTWTSSASMLVKMGYEEMFVKLATTQRIRLAVKVFEGAYADGDCQTAHNINWNEVIYLDVQEDDENATAWFAIDITVPQLNKVDLTVTIANRGEATAEVIAEVAFDCPYVDLQTVTDTLAVGQSISRRICYSTLVILPNVVYVGITTTQSIEFEIVPTMSPLIYPSDLTCVSAVPFNWEEGHKQAADVSVWYGIPTANLWNVDYIYEIAITNEGDKELTINSELSSECPVIYENQHFLLTIAANGTYSKVISRDLLTNLRRVETIFIKLTGNQPFSFRFNKKSESNDLQTLYVTIDEEKISNYRNMFLELLDMQSKSLRRYSITNKNTYAFSGVFNGRNSLLSLRNAQHKVFGKETVSFVGNDTTVTFSSLLLPVDLQVQVQNAEGTDLTEHTTVTWTDAKGNYLSKGTELKGLVEGDTVYYRIDLDETAGTVYLQPDTAIRVIADPQTRLLKYLLPVLSTKTISGCVIDSTSRRPLNNASVIVTQTINNKYPKLFKTTTSADGKFELQMAAAPFEMVVTASNYNKRILSNLQLKDSIPMTELSCARISCELQYLAAVMDGDEPVVQNWYQDYSDIYFRVFNTTRNTAVDIIEVQYPRIFIDVEDGDELNITAASRTNQFMPVDATATVMDQKASVTFLIKELGHIHASYSFSENESVAGWLYDAKGKFVRDASFEKTTMVMDNLTDGNYTLVVIGKSEMFNTVYDIRNLSHIGLVKDADYVSQSISVESGKISTVSIDTVPALDVSKLIYTNGSASFTVSDQSIIIGNYLTLRGYVDFKREYAPSVSNVKLIIDIPEGCSFVEKSVMVSNHTSGYTLEGSRLIVPLDYASQRVLCCVIPTISGQYAPSAYVQFDLKGETITSPIGATGFTAEALSIFVPSVTTKPAVTVSGEAFGNAKVEVYDNGTLIGKTTAPSSGIWRMECELADAYNLSSHHIYAKATGAGMEQMSETKECFYNKNANAVKTVKMTHYNAWYGRNMDVVFDMEKESVSPSSYYFYDGAEYSFVVDFINNDPSAVSDVNVYAFDYNGEITKLPAEYDEQSGRWIAMHYFDHSNAPVNVSVDFLSDSRYVYDAQKLESDMSEVEVIFNQWKWEVEEFDTEYNNNDITLPNAAIYEELETLFLQETLDEQRINELIAKLVALSPTCENADLSLADEANFDKEMGENDAMFNKLIAERKDSLFASWLLDGDIFTEGFRLDPFTYEPDGQEYRISMNIVSSVDENVLTEKGFQPLTMTDESVIWYLTTQDTIHFIDPKRGVEISKIFNKSDNNYIGERKFSITAIPTSCIDATSGLLNRLINGGDVEAWRNNVDVAKAIMDGIACFYELVYNSVSQNTVLSWLLEIRKSYQDQYDAWLLHMSNKKVVSGSEYKSDLRRLTRLEKRIKITDERIKDVKKLKRETIDKMVGKLPERLTGRLPRLEYRTKVTGKIAGGFGLLISLYDAYCDVVDMQENINRWIILREDIEGKIPCEGNEDKAIALRDNILSDGKALQNNWIRIISADVLGLVADAAQLKEWKKPEVGLALYTVSIYLNLYTTISKIKSIDEKFLTKEAKYWIETGKLVCGEKEPDPSPTPNPKPKPKPTPNPPTPRTPPTTIQWDPSGFVYEGVEDNRLEGVKATVYYKTTQEDPSGGTTETEVLWDAEEYGQENPLFTDEFGMYRWDVPQGLWQVRFEKDGYEPTQSEWLPVPPPQLDVNIPMVQLSQPEVVFAAAYKDAVILRFDKYMRTELLTRDNIFVSAGNQVIAGTLILSDTRDNQTDYTREVRFVPDEEFDVPAITLTVSNHVCSYAGIPMAYTFRQEFDLDGVSVIQPAAAPTASIPDGSVVSPYTELYLDCETDNAVIRYTTDGTDPDCYNGLVYTGYPIPLTEHTTTIRAIACAEGYDASEIAVFRYSIMGTSLDNPASPVRVFVEDRTLRVEGLDVTCYIYTVQGQLLYAGGNGAYRLPCGGVYLIRHGNEVVKVVL